MRKIFISIILLTSALNIKAQTEKGKILLGGKISFGHTTSNYKDNLQFPELEKPTELPYSKSTGNSFSLGPSVGFFLQNNFAVGLSITYQHGTNKLSGSFLNANNGQLSSASFASDSKYNSYYLSPYARYYINIAEKFKFFGQFSVPMMWSDAKESFSFSEIKANNKIENRSIGASLQPGFAYFPSKKLSIELSFNGLEYYHSNFKNKITGDKFSSNSIGFTGDTTAPKLGMMFHL